MDSTKLFYFYLCDVWREFMLLVEQTFQEFGEAVVLWAHAMTDRAMPGDWRDRLADFLADWEDEHGTIVEDHSLPVLFDWVAALGRQRGALARDPNVVYPEDAWMKCNYRVPVAPTPSSGASGRVIDGVLTVTAKDIGDLTWRDLLRALAAYRLPSDARALMILIQGRDPRPFCTIFLSAELLRAFLQLPLADRQAIMSAASCVSVEAAQAAITRAVAAKTAARNPRPSGGKLAPSPELPYNQKRSPEVSQTAAPSSPSGKGPKASAAGDADGQRQATDPSGRVITYVPGRLTPSVPPTFDEGEGAKISRDIYSGFGVKWIVHNVKFLRNIDGKQCKLCDEIGVIQIVKGQASVSPFNPFLHLNYSWEIDSVDADPAYGKGHNGGAVRGDPATLPEIGMEDGPNFSIAPGVVGWKVDSLRQDFETYVVCLKGREGIKKQTDVSLGGTITYANEITVYAGVIWYHEFTARPDGSFNAVRKVTSSNASPGANFAEAISKWFTHAVQNPAAPF